MALDELKHQSLTFKPMEASHSYQHPKNLNAVYADGVCLGEMGIVHPTVSKKLDKKASIVYLELDMAALAGVSDAGIHYQEASKYPGMEVDLTFLSDRYAPIAEAIRKADSPLIKGVKLIDMYQGEDGNAITLRLTFSCMDRTLTRDEVMAVANGIIEDLSAQGIRLK